MAQIVGVGDLKFSSDRDDVLITYALGSCLGVSVYEPVVGVGGLLHAMLPLSSADPIKAQQRPEMYVDSGFAALMKALFRFGARKENMIISVAGGASMKQISNDDYFKIGQRNFTVLRKLLWKNGLMIHAQDVGGGNSRTMALYLESGLVTINKQPIASAVGQKAPVF
jgi:chemotaxis protein CheD